MFNFNENPSKNYVVVSVVVIVILALVNFWSYSPARHQTPTQQTNTETQVQSAKSYAELLKAADTDPDASQTLLKQIVTEDNVKQQLAAALHVGSRPPAAPNIDTSSLVVIPNSKEAVQTYLSNLSNQTDTTNTRLAAANKLVFVAGADTAQLDSAIQKTQEFIGQLMRMQVPQDLVVFHKAVVITYTEYVELFRNARQYAVSQSNTPWPQLYSEYAIANDQILTVNAELTRLAKKYSFDPPHESNLGLFGIHEAHAQILGGTIIIADLPRAIKWAIEEALLLAFGHFMQSFLTTLISDIDRQYHIANYLFYIAPVDQQYSLDYLKKYVPDTQDRQIVQKLLPAFNCGKFDPNLKDIFKKKAQDYLGFDPTKIDPNTAPDDFLAKMASVGATEAQPFGQEDIYRSLARQTEAEANRATDIELTDPNGIKKSRSLDTSQNTIDQAVQTVTTSLQSALISVFNMGTNNSNNLISQLTVSLLEPLFSKLLFSGAHLVYAEQPVCLNSEPFKITPIIGSNYDPYQYTPPAN